MDLDFSAAELSFRDEVRAFLDEQLTEDLRAATRATTTVFAEPNVGMAWQRILQKKGWLGYQWPKTYGGTGWTPVERYIFEKECALADAPPAAPLGTRLLGPILLEFGTEAQKAFYLPRILSGDDYWCQGFSESGAGSDLAAVKTTAVRRGDHYVVNGSKMWTTHAHAANRMFCLVRTDTAAPPRRGLSLILIDMKRPGIQVQPILGLAGDHEVNAVFLDNVIVPRSDLVGTEGDGWRIAKSLLEHERGGSCYAPKLLADISRVRMQAERVPDGHGGRLGRTSRYAADLARLELEALALETTELRILSDMAAGQTSGPYSSIVKLVASNLRQQLDELAMRTCGYAGLFLRSEEIDRKGRPAELIDPVDARTVAASFLNSRAWTIFGGSNEIQRSIIAKALLRL